MKVLALIEQHDRLKSLVAQMDALSAREDQEITFLKKKVEDMRQRYQKEAQEIWNDIEDYLHGQDLVPWDFSEKKGHSFVLNKKMGVIMCDMEPEKKASSFEAFIKQLFH